MTMPNGATSVTLATRVRGEPRGAPLEKLREFLEKEGMKSKTGPRSFADFERELHERMMETAVGSGAGAVVYRRASVSVPFG
jgi:hypothetical protein